VSEFVAEELSYESTGGYQKNHAEPIVLDLLGRLEAGGLPAGVAGTSAACPVVAATFAKLNEIRLARKRERYYFSGGYFS